MESQHEAAPGPVHRTASLTLAGSLVWLALATLLGFLGSLHWFLDLFAHFRAQYFAIALALGTALALLRLWRWLAGAAIVTAVNLALLIPLWVGPGTDFDDTLRPLRLVTFNVFAGNSSEGISAITQRYLERRPELVVLLEPRWESWRDHLVPALDAGYALVLRTERTDTFNIIVLSRIPGVSASLRELTEYRIPLVEISLRWQGRPLVLAAVHPPPPTNAKNTGVRDEYLLAAAEWARTRAVPAIVAGDLNATPWSAIFSRLLDRTGLLNSQRGFGIQPTWCDTCGPMRIPIDHVLHSKEFVTVSREVGPELGSDHSAVWVSLAWAKPVP